MNHDALEHESGLRPLGEFPDHCERCRQVADMRSRQAVCPHGLVAEIKVLTGEVVSRYCEDCGASV